MKFLRLPDPLLTCLYEDDDIIAIDKAYGFNSHTNDSKIEHSDFIQDGLIEIFEKQRGCKLHIIHRLDQTTSGVIIFGKSVASAKKYAEYFFNKQVQKTYLFITAAISNQDNFKIDLPIIHKGKELEAQTDFLILNKTKRYELWKALPHTGRNHQIRIHAQAAGIPLLGDIKYTGAPFPFLCLHNHQIEFPNGIKITSKPPAYFTDLNLIENKNLSELLFANDRRERLFGQNATHNAYRLFQNDITDKTEKNNFIVDSYPDFLNIKYLSDSIKGNDDSRFNQFSEILKKQIQIQFNSQKQTQPSMNQRLHRHWVTENSKSKTVLNLFSSLGGYSLSAAIGGAHAVTTVDDKKNNLELIKKTYIDNKIELDPHFFYCRDSISFLKRCVAQNQKYNLIICEVPHSYRGEKSIFKINVDLEDFILNCVKGLSEPGQILLIINSAEINYIHLNDIFIRIQKKTSLKNLEFNSILPALDCELPQEKSTLKSFIIEKTP